MSEGLLLAGRYRLAKKLGSGGMGSVWRAEDLNLGAEVAVKLLEPTLAESGEALLRFRREAQAAASIRSTYVVQILDHGIDQGTPYIAMELLKGENLAQRLERVGTLSPEQTGRLLGHVGRALSLAHEHGIVHRDMKPENIFLVREDDEDVGKVLDFGIARKRGGLADVGGLKTSTGALLGTPYYMSPEQATGQSVDHRTDIWSVGAIACECLTGRRAYDAESLGALFHAICIASPQVPSRLAAVPAGFDAWFARATARDATQRFQTIKEATDELRALCARAAGRSSAAFLPGSHDEIGLSRDAAAPAITLGADAFDLTAPPSSKTVPGHAKIGYLRAGLLLVPALAIIFGVGYAGWHWLTAPPIELSAASATGAQTSPSIVPLPAAAPVAITQSSTATVVEPDVNPAPRLGRTEAQPRVAVVPATPRGANKPTSVAKLPASSASTKPAPTTDKAKGKPAPASVREKNVAGI